MKSTKVQPSVAKQNIIKKNNNNEQNKTDLSESKGMQISYVTDIIWTPENKNKKEVLKSLKWKLPNNGHNDLLRVLPVIPFFRTPLPAGSVYPHIREGTFKTVTITINQDHYHFYKMNDPKKGEPLNYLALDFKNGDYVEQLLDCHLQEYIRFTEINNHHNATYINIFLLKKEISIDKNGVDHYWNSATTSDKAKYIRPEESRLYLVLNVLFLCFRSIIKESELPKLQERFKMSINEAKLKLLDLTLQQCKSDHKLRKEAEENEVEDDVEEEEDDEKEEIEEVRAYHVTNIVQKNDTHPNWNHLNANLADCGTYDGDLVGLIVVCLSVTLCNGELPTFTVYPRDGKAGKYWRVTIRINLNDYHIYKLNECTIKGNKQVHYLALDMQDGDYVEHMLDHFLSITIPDQRMIDITRNDIVNDCSSKTFNNVMLLHDVDISQLSGVWDTVKKRVDHNTSGNLKSFEPNNRLFHVLRWMQEKNSDNAVKAVNFIKTHPTFPDNGTTEAKIFSLTFELSKIRE